MAQAAADRSAGDEPDPQAFDNLLSAARSGCAQSLSALADRYRRYLLHAANGSLSPELRAKVGASDLVQDTLLHVHQRFADFDGRSEAELLAWMRRILYFRTLRVARHYGGTAARDVRRELPLTEAGSALRAAPIVDPAPTPCTSAVAGERLAELDAALASLGEEARQLILMRSIDRMGFEQIGQRLGCSADAARQRWARAIARLRLRDNDNE